MTNFAQLRDSINFEKLYLCSMLLFAFSMTLSRSAISFFMLFLPFIWIVEGNFRDKFGVLRQSSLLKPFILLFTFVIIGLAMSGDMTEGLNIFKKYCYWFTIIVIATTLKKEHLNTIITAFLAGLFVSEMVAYSAFFEIWIYKNTLPQNPTPFMNHIDYSVYLGFASVLILNRIFIKNYNKWQKLILILLLLMTLGNLFIIGGRTGQFALVFTLVVFFILHFNVRLKAIVLGLLTIIVIYSVAYNFSETFHQRVTASKNEIQKALEGNFRSSWGIRLAYWELTYHILKEDPLLGVGLGDYKHAFKHVLDSKKLDKYNNIYNDLIENHSHNQYLMMVAQMGLLGLFVMIYFLYKLFAVSVKIDDRGFRYLFILFLVFYSISFLAEPLWYKQFPRTLWILFIGLLANLEIRGSLIKNRSLFISRQQRTEQSSTKLN